MIKDIYIDMDGVLVDFATSAIKAILNLDLTNAQYDSLTEYGFKSYFESIDQDIALFWKLARKLGNDFYSNLPWTDNGQEFYSRLTDLADKYRVTRHICTKPYLTQGCFSGKLTWLMDNCQDIVSNTIFIQDKSLLANSNSLLIDDHITNIENFIRKGGKALAYPQPWTIKGYCSTYSTDYCNDILYQIEQCLITSI